MSCVRVHLADRGEEETHLELEDVRRLDPDRLLKHSTQPNREPRPRVAVIGAGMSGLICARTLFSYGMQVAVFEKSRGFGGRMATRRTAEGPTFDHGAQYFTVRDERFERCVRSWQQDGIVAHWGGKIGVLTNGDLEWQPKTTPRFVGVPGMNAVCRHLAADLKTQFRTRVGPPQTEAWPLATVRRTGQTPWRIRLRRYIRSSAAVCRTFGGGT